jgi:DNA-binding HxlR family transcriptional regulator
MATNSSSLAYPEPYCAGESCEFEVARTIALIAGRWAVPIMEALYFAGEPVRFRALQRLVGSITQKELARQLTLFVHHGVLRRREQEGSRTAVDYALTPRGLALLKQMDALGRWAKRMDPIG